MKIKKQLFRNYINSGKKIIFVLNRCNDDHEKLVECLHEKYQNLEFEIKHLNIRLETRIKQVKSMCKNLGLSDELINIELNLN